MTNLIKIGPIVWTSTFVHEQTYTNPDIVKIVYRPLFEFIAQWDKMNVYK